MVIELLIQWPAGRFTESLTERLIEALDSVVSRVVDAVVTECEFG